MLGNAFVFVSVIETLRTMFTPLTRLARALTRGTGGSSRSASATIAIATSTPRIAALFLMRVSGSLTHRIVVTCFSLCQSEL